MPESLLIVESETIDEFCEKEKISRSFYFQMQREGWGPDEASLGRLKRITPESHQRWRRQRERAAQLGVRGALPASELSSGLSCEAPAVRGFEDSRSR